MRIAIAAMVGALLATGASLTVVQLSIASQKEPVIKPLYNYGSR